VIEVRIERDVFELVTAFKEVYAEIVAEDPTAVTDDDLINAVLRIGLPLMVEQFFRSLEQPVLENSLAAFYQANPHVERERLHATDAMALSDSLVSLCQRFPKLFFPFMLRVLREQKAAAARSKWAQLFPERTGE
jgi:hypothetical protein